MEHQTILVYETQVAVHILDLERVRALSTGEEHISFDLLGVMIEGWLQHAEMMLDDSLPVPDFDIPLPQDTPELPVDQQMTDWIFTNLPFHN